MDVSPQWAPASSALALIAAPANAFTVTNSGSSNSVTGTAKGAVTFSVGQPLTCTSSSIGLTVNPGSTNLVANITYVSWSGCDWNGYPATVTVTNPNWLFNYSSGATSAASDSVQGAITNISGILVSISGPSGTCTFNLSGATDAAFAEDNGKGGQQLGFLPPAPR